LDDLRDANILQKLKWVFSDPERLRPGKTRQALTEEAAAEFAKLAQRLRDRGNEAEAVAHFINRLVFCMFAEDVDLLPNKMFRRMLEHATTHPESFQSLASDLFRAMKSGGRVGFEHVGWFNGGLFNDDVAIPLEAAEVVLTLQVARLDWSEIDPSILGTLFERGLDPNKRSQLGAHYTDREKIMMIVDPVVKQPWLAEWEKTKEIIATAMKVAQEAQERLPKVQAQARRVHMAARRAEETAKRSALSYFVGFLDSLKKFRVLDPACGSGNFLYVALLTLKDIEHKANIEAELLGLPRQTPSVGPGVVLGIEINPFAAELARVSVWIGEIQWMRRNGFWVSDRPILKPLENIECRDAILNADGSETTWPDADVLIGNPPYLGAKLMYRRLGRPETERLRAAFVGRLPGFTDLVCYWFEKAREKMMADRTKRVGFVATNSIAKNTNLPVLLRIVADLDIYEAWSDEEWVVDGAAVRVALICFAQKDLHSTPRLNGQVVACINANLTTGTDLSQVKKLPENRGASLLGIQKSGPFDVPGDLARQWLALPINPNGAPNADVLKPFRNGDDVVGRPRDMWLIDFPLNRAQQEIAFFEDDPP
jgi:hypothetical protein